MGGQPGGRGRIAVVLLVAVLLVASATGGSAQTPTAEPSAARAKEDALGLLLNRARVREGLKPLARNPALDRAAQEHSRDMAEHDYLEHTALDGTASIDRAIRAGYGARKDTGWTATEVISAISDDPQGPLHWWLEESPEIHGKVLRDPRWREVGIGYAAGGRYGNYWTVLVGCQPGVLPAVVLDGQTYRHVEDCDQSPVPSPVAMPTASPAPPTPSPTPGSRITMLPRTGAAGVDQVEVRWQALPDPQPADWVGLFPAGAPDSGYVAWIYLGCTTVPTAAPPSAGACSLAVPAGLSAGDYETRLFRVGGGTATLRSDRAALQPPPAVQLEATSAVLRPGERVQVSWAGLPAASARDWLALYPADHPDRPSIAWSYVSCSTAAVEAKPRGSCELSVPLDAEPGRYELQFFRDDAFTPSGAKAVVVMPASSPPLAPA